MMKTKTHLKRLLATGVRFDRLTLVMFVYDIVQATENTVVYCR